MPAPEPAAAAGDDDDAPGRRSAGGGVGLVMRLLLTILLPRGGDLVDEADAARAGRRRQVGAGGADGGVEPCPGRLRARATTSTATIAPVMALGRP